MGVLGLEPTTGPGHRRAADEPPRFGPWLALWAALTVALNGGLWVAGFRTAELAAAVEQGAARAESRGVGEVGDDLIRKAIRTQHETRPFWAVLALLADFLAEPLAPAGRAVAAATAFAAVAALRGRVVGYDRALAAFAAAQGFWVLGLAVRAAMMVALRRGDVETTAALFLPPGTYPAAVALTLRQLDPFALVGWSVIAFGAVGRGQVRWPGAVAVALTFAAIEAAARVSLGLMVGAGMRLAVT
jgi:hypothetical protein